MAASRQSFPLSSSASPRSVEGVYESLNPELLVLKRGFWQKAGAYMNKLGKRFSYIDPDQSPLEMADPPSILYIPSGGVKGPNRARYNLTERHMILPYKNLTLAQQGQGSSRTLASFRKEVWVWIFIVGGP